MASGQVIISGVILFALYYFLLREIGSNQLGLWSIVLATSSAVRLSELGLSGGVVRFVAKYVAQGDAGAAAKVIETAAVSIACILAVILVLIYPAISSVLKYFIPPESHSQGLSLLPFAFASMWLGTVGGIFTSGLDGVLRTDLRSLVMIGATAFHFAIVLMLVPTYGLLGLGYAQVIQSMFIVILSWWLLRRKLSSLPLFPYRWNRPLFNEMFKYGLNIQAASVAVLFFDPTTKMLLSKFSGLDSVAFYEMASRMVIRIRSVVVSANQVMVPVFSTMYEEAPEEIVNAYRKSYGLLIFLAMPVFGVLVALIPMMSEFWIGAYQPIFVGLSLVLAIAWFINTLNAPAYFSNMGTGHLNWNTITQLTIGILNVFLGLVFGYFFGGQGVAIGFALALVIGSSAVTINYHLKNEIPFIELASKQHHWLFMASLMGPICTWWAYSEFRERLGLGVLAVISVILIICIILPAFWTHPIRRKMWRSALST